MVGIRNFQDTFKTRKRSFISAFSICMTVHLKLVYFYFITPSKKSFLVTLGQFSLTRKSLKHDIQTLSIY